MSAFEYELGAIRSKLVRLLEVYGSVGQVGVAVNEWPVWLEKMNALGSQYHALQKELTMALESAIVEPCAAGEGNLDYGNYLVSIIRLLYNESNSTWSTAAIENGARS